MKTPYRKRVLPWIGSIVAFSVLIWVLLQAPEKMVQWEISGPQKTDDRLRPEQYARLIDDNRKTLAQVLFGLGALGTIFFSWRRMLVEQETLRVTQENLRVAQQNLETTRDSKITERFAKAVEQLGAINTTGRKLLEIRFGGIYALERIARDSPSDHWTVMEILTAYVRENAPWIEDEDEPSEFPKDIQAILAVLGRRTLQHETDENLRLDLRSTDLRTASLSNAHLKRVLLGRARLDRSNLEGASLDGADFANASLQGAVLRNAYLRRASFFRAHLESANCPGAHFEQAFFAEAYLKKATFTGAYLNEAYFPDAQLEEVNFFGACLEGAGFDGAHLEGADFSHTKVQGVRFTRARLGGANLRTAIGLTKEQLADAMLSSETTLPDYLDYLLPPPE